MFRFVYIFVYVCWVCNKPSTITHDKKLLQYRAITTYILLLSRVIVVANLKRPVAKDRVGNL